MKTNQRIFDERSEMMKWEISILIAMMLIAIMTGCSPQFSPEGVAKAGLRALSDGNEKKIRDVFTSDFLGQKIDNTTAMDLLLTDCRGIRTDFTYQYDSLTYSGMVIDTVKIYDKTRYINTIIVTKIGNKWYISTFPIYYDSSGKFACKNLK